MLRFKVHTTGIDSLPDKVRNGSEKVEKALANEVMKDTDKYVPMLTGSLKNRTHIEGTKIIYPGPYARYLYYGKVMIDPKIGAAGFRLADGTWRSRKGAKKVVTEKDLVYTKSAHPNAQSYWFEASKAQNIEKWKRMVGKLVVHFGGK